MASKWTQRVTAALAASLIGAGGGAHAMSVADLPLFISTSATPNVMILFDDSGSMDNIMWADAFDPAVTYPVWSNLQADTTYFLGGGGGARWVTLQRNSDQVQTRLKLPDPAGGGSTRYLGNYLNFLYETYPSNTDLTLIPGLEKHRMGVARTVATNIVNNNTNLRLGLSSFYAPTSGDGAPGGSIDRACGSSTANLLSTIANYRSEANTPLAETFYEVTRYFRGMASFFTPGTTFASPIQYRCQKNFVVVVTDGFPTWDTQFPTNDPDDAANAAASLPNWDGLAPATQASDFPLFPQYSDGYAFDQAAAQGEGRTLYLDDLAKFAFDVDMKASGNDSANGSFNDPMFAKQNLFTYTVGFTVANQMLQDAAGYGDGAYYTAKNETQLSQALQAAFADIQRRTSSASAVATNSTRLSGSTYLYQARFSSADWSGQLLAFPLLAGGAIGTQAWNAATLMPVHDSRQIFTSNPAAGAGSRGLQFNWASLTAAQQAALNKNGAGVTDGKGPQRLLWLRGDRSNESPLGHQFRARNPETVLGDIVNSDPALVSSQNFGFDQITDSNGDPTAEAAAYEDYLTAKASRAPMIYVGANDGMLHAFDASSGVERFAYVPNAVYGKLSALTERSYAQSHKFLVDGSPRLVDAYFGDGWQTVLLGSLGAGGKAAFALRVTNPTGFNASDVLWEFSDANDTDMGVGIPQGSVARMANGQWVALVANGYDSASDRAKLLILDLATGAVIRKIDTGVGSATEENGLSSPIPVDVDGDRITDYIYAGDLRGNMWKFDVTSANPTQWDVAFRNGGNAAPLFTACDGSSCTSSNRQPITARPEVGLNPSGGVIVFFGTGRYFAVGDNSVPANAQVQAFYGVQDRNEKGATNPQPNGGRSTLLQQTVTGTRTLTFDGISEIVRTTTDYLITNSNQGWFINLPENGERNVSAPVLRGGRIVFATLTPSTDPCGFGGTSWLMEVDAVSGSRLPYSPFDLNRDGLFNDIDFANSAPVSGRQSKEGIIKTPGIITDGEVEYKYASGTSGGVDTTVERGNSATGRQSWRQFQ